MYATLFTIQTLISVPIRSHRLLRARNRFKDYLMIVMIVLLEIVYMGIIGYLLKLYNCTNLLVLADRTGQSSCEPFDYRLRSMMSLVSASLHIVAGMVVPHNVFNKQKFNNPLAMDYFNESIFQISKLYVVFIGYMPPHFIDFQDLVLVKLILLVLLQLVLLVRMWSSSPQLGYLDLKITAKHQIPLPAVLLAMTFSSFLSSLLALCITYTPAMSWTYAPFTIVCLLFIALAVVIAVQQSRKVVYPLKQVLIEAVALKDLSTVTTHINPLSTVVVYMSNGAIRDQFHQLIGQSIAEISSLFGRIHASIDSNERAVEWFHQMQSVLGVLQAILKYKGSSKILFRDSRTLSSIVELGLMGHAGIIDLLVTMTTDDTFITYLGEHRYRKILERVLGALSNYTLWTFDETGCQCNNIRLLEAKDPRWQLIQIFTSMRKILFDRFHCELVVVGVLATKVGSIEPWKSYECIDPIDRLQKSIIFVPWIQVPINVSTHIVDWFVHYSHIIEGYLSRHPLAMETNYLNMYSKFVNMYVTHQYLFSRNIPRINHDLAVSYRPVIVLSVSPKDRLESTEINWKEIGHSDLPSECIRDLKEVVPNHTQSTRCIELKSKLLELESRVNGREILRNNILDVVLNVNHLITETKSNMSELSQTVRTRRFTNLHETARF